MLNTKDGEAEKKKKHHERYLSTGAIVINWASLTIEDTLDFEDLLSLIKTIAVYLEP